MAPDEAPEAGSAPTAAARGAGEATTTSAADHVRAGRDAEDSSRERAAALRRRRDGLATELHAARAANAESDRRRAQAEAATALAERQLAYAARTAADLAEREARLATEREDLVSLLVDAERAVGQADAALAAIVGVTTAERERLRAAEAAAMTVRERVRVAQERTRVAERDDVEARLAIEGLREQLLVELAGLGATALRHLRGDEPA